MVRTDKKLVLLSITAMFCAIITAMTFIPYVGYITYGLLSITTLHVVAILGAVLLGPARGTFIGFWWGVTCLLYALVNGTADAAIFINPLISVVPRIFVGLVAAWVFRWFSALFRKGESASRKYGDVGAAVIAAVAGTLTNTVLVLSAINLFGGSGIVKMGVVLKNIITVAISLNGVVELAMAVILVPALSIPLFQTMNKMGLRK